MGIYLRAREPKSMLAKIACLILVSSFDRASPTLAMFNSHCTDVPKVPRHTPPPPSTPSSQKMQQVRKSAYPWSMPLWLIYSRNSTCTIHARRRAMSCQRGKIRTRQATIFENATRPRSWMDRQSVPKAWAPPGHGRMHLLARPDIPSCWDDLNNRYQQ
jgi:hypothetical protein